MVADFRKHGALFLELLWIVLNALFFISGYRETHALTTCNFTKVFGGYLSIPINNAID